MSHAAEETRKLLKEHSQKWEELHKKHQEEEMKEHLEIVEACPHDEIEHYSSKHNRHGTDSPAWDQCKICGIDVSHLRWKEAQNAQH